MTTRKRPCTVAMILVFGLAAAAWSQGAVPAPKGLPMMRASGSFDVTLVPRANDAAEGGSMLARLSIDKQFHGDLEATSKGEMLSAATAVKDSAGYVAIERVTGVLQGKKGSFVLQHTGTMDRGAPSLSVTVVPDSGTGALAGLTGTMTIDIVDGKHLYGFEYGFLSR